jgi:uncharacterized protein YoxC
MDITGLVNYTDSIKAIEVSENGNFTGVWTVPDILILNTTVNQVYTVNATDDEGLYAETTITIVEEEVEIWPTATTYALGDTITFRIRATFTKANSYLEIRDPEDELYFMSVFTQPEWTSVDPWKVVQIRNQVDDASGYPYTIPTDAMTGTWIWVLYDSDDEQIMNGTIEVIPTTAAQVDARLTALEGGLADLADDISGVTSELEDDLGSLASDLADVAAEVDDIVAELADDIASAKDAADAATAAVSDLEDAVGDIADTANEAKSSADSAKAAADAAKTSADEAKTAATGLTTLVYGAIGASLIAALAAIVSLMQISRKIA